jgi:hypothetical protein
MYHTSKTRVYKKCDTYETPTGSLDMLLTHLDPAVHYIWEPFVGSGHSTRHMRQVGFTVTNGDDPDFFEQSVPVAPEGLRLVLVSNPPFSLKQQILRHLSALGVYDVALLLPAPALFTKYFHEYSFQRRVQVIIHSKRCAFLDATTGEAAGPASFDIAWICLGLELPRDLCFPLIA